MTTILNTTSRKVNTTSWIQRVVASPSVASSSISRKVRCISTRPLPRVSIANVKDDVAEILRPYYNQQTPVILQGYTSSWPAVSKWKDWDSYLPTRVDANEWHCDVEMGTYNDSERLSIPFAFYLDYLRLHREQQQQAGANDNTKEDPPPILYLAQNELPHGLYPDICLPPFLKSNHFPTTPTETTTTTTSASSTSTQPTPQLLGQGKLYQCMFWMGPPQSESPLHYDPLDNLLCQIVGTKQVALLDCQAPRDVLQAGPAHGQQENTSALPMGSLLQQSRPHADATRRAVDDLPFLTGTLQPGDSLYIPSKWWHYVQSPTDFTISVNVWWR